MNFRVGQKVVCMDAAPHAKYSPWKVRLGASMDGLKDRAIYTVRAVNLYRGQPCIYLAEIARSLDPNIPEAGEPGYSPKRFRPVVERKTDISIFTAMLDKTPERVG
jgi:hypothetical protein